MLLLLTFLFQVTALHKKGVKVYVKKKEAEDDDDAAAAYLWPLPL